MTFRRERCRRYNLCDYGDLLQTDQRKQKRSVHEGKFPLNQKKH
jgi:hypothetical protein